MAFACVFTSLPQALVYVACYSDLCKRVVNNDDSGKCVWYTGSTQLVVSKVLFFIVGVTILLGFQTRLSVQCGPRRFRGQGSWKPPLKRVQYPRQGRANAIKP